MANSTTQRPRRRAGRRGGGGTTATWRRGSSARMMRPQQDRAVERAPQAGHVVERPACATTPTSATYASEKSRVISARSMAADGQHGAGQHQPDVHGAAAHEAEPVLRQPEHQRDAAQHRSGEAERDAGHAERAVHRPGAITARYAGTRSGFSALYSLSCFTRMRSAANVPSASFPSTTAGAPGLEQVARLAALVADRHRRRR